MKLFFCLLAAASIAFSAEKPEWVSNNGKSIKYPDSRFLTGYGFSRVTDGNDRPAAQAAASEYARKNLIEKVKVQIQSVTTQRTEESGEKFSSMYSSATQSTSSLELQGLQTESYYDKGDDMQYVFVYAERDPLAALYESKIKQLKQEITGKKKEAESFEQQGNAAQAFNAYAACLPLSRQLEEAQTVKSYIRISNVAAELQTEAQDNEVTMSDIRRSITRLMQRPLKTIDDIAWYLTYILKEQADQRSEHAPLSVMASSLYYQDTKLGSSFSRYFKQVLENKLIEVGKWTVVQQGAGAMPASSDPAREYARVAGAKYVLTGSLWEQGASVKFIVNVRSVADGSILASAEAAVDANVVASAGKSLKPENYQQVMIDQKVFAKGEVAGGGLTLEAWTNRGVDNVMYAENDTMNVAVRVNYPCYIRLIYHMADGKRVLLLDNYFIDQSKINLAYQIPDEFVCAEPFGGETLQIFARTEKFDDLMTEKIDGYNYLKEDLQKIVVSTRGFKKAAPKSMHAEQRIQITTMKE
jgi:hypothetical protein